MLFKKYIYIYFSSAIFNLQFLPLPDLLQCVGLSLARITPSKPRMSSLLTKQVDAQNRPPLTPCHLHKPLHSTTAAPGHVT